MSLKLGSNGPVVAAWQAAMVKRFASYAKGADGQPLRADAYFGRDDSDVQREYQLRTRQQITGQVSDHDLQALGIVTAPTKLPVILCAQGTGVDMWTGPPADIGRAVESQGKARFQPLGDWPATPFPMWPSITQGVASAEVQIRKWAGVEDCDLYLVGYSQGAAVMSLLRKYSFAPGGVLADLRHKVKRAVMLGNPMRQGGIATSDGGQLARTSSAGIMVDRLTDTPEWWVEYAHAGDLYADCELDDEGEWKRAICKIVMGNQWWAGQDNIFEQVCEVFGKPLEEGWAVAMALFGTIRFFGSGTRPHVTYNVQPAIDYLSA